MKYFLRLWIAYSCFIVVIVPAYAIVQYELHGIPSHLVLDTLHSAGVIEKPDYGRVLDVDELLPTVIGLVILPPAIAGVFILTATGAYSTSKYGIPGLIRIRGRLGSQSKRAARFENYRRQAQRSNSEGPK